MRRILAKRRGEKHWLDTPLARRAARREVPDNPDRLVQYGINRFSARRIQEICWRHYADGYAEAFVRQFGQRTYQRGASDHPADLNYEPI